jgi:hypothetical protein
VLGSPLHAGVVLVGHASRGTRDAVALDLQEQLGVGVVRLAANASALVGESACLVEPMPEQRERRAPHRHVPVVGGQTQLGGEPLVLIDRRPHRFELAELEQVSDAPVDPLQLGLAVP